MATEPSTTWLTIREAMAYLKVSRPTLYRFMADGRLPFYTVGASTDRRFRRADLDAALLPGTPQSGRPRA